MVKAAAGDFPSAAAPQRLEEALRLNAPLATVYYMKEDLRQIWEQPDKATAARFLDEKFGHSHAAEVCRHTEFSS